MGTGASQLDTSEPIETEGGTIDLRRRIGFGGFSVVYKGKFKGDFCAVKIRTIRTALNSFRKYRGPDPSDVELETFQPPTIRHSYIVNEVKYLRRLAKSSFVVHLVKELTSEGRSFMITEYVRFRLVDVLNIVPDFFFESVLFHLMTPILFTLRYMHRNFLVHRDIKPLNILVSKQGIPKICDFEHCTKMKQDTGSYDPISALSGGTPYFVAPEHLRRDKCDGRVDSFAIGLTFLCLVNKIETPESFFGGMPFSNVVKGYDILLKRKDWTTSKISTQVSDLLKSSVMSSKVPTDGKLWNKFRDQYLCEMISLDQNKRITLEKLCSWTPLEATYTDWRCTLTYCKKPPSNDFGRVHARLLDLLLEQRKKEKEAR